MSDINELLHKNQDWSRRVRVDDPRFFERLEAIQRPDYLWIGCSDSRVPANQIVDLAPGELFVHRNIANLIIHTDFNCLTVVQYAIEVLRVKHIIVCGHYGCGGIEASLGHDEYGVVDNWLHHVKDIIFTHKTELAELSHSEQSDRLCELNVMNQVQNLAHTKAVQYAWGRGQSLGIHGWVYSLHDGLINDLQVSAYNSDDIDETYRLRETKRDARPHAND